MDSFPSAKHLTWILSLHSPLAPGFHIVQMCQHESRNQCKKTCYIPRDSSLNLIALVLKQGECGFQEITLTQVIRSFSSDFSPELVYLFVFFSLFHFTTYFVLLLAFVIASLWCDCHHIDEEVLSLAFSTVTISGFWNLVAQRSNIPKVQHKPIHIQNRSKCMCLHTCAHTLVQAFSLCQTFMV